MKLTNVQVVAPKMTAGAGQNERQADRVKRMMRFWQAGENAVLYPVGRFLAMMADAKRTIAQVIADGEEVELDTINVDGKQLPLAPGFKLSLKNVAQQWGCPACHSAHGSGVYPSREVSAKLLASAKFYYRPSDKALFTISDTCWKDYVDKLGAAVDTRFMAPGSEPKKAQVVAPKAAPVPLKA